VPFLPGKAAQWFNLKLAVHLRGNRSSADVISEQVNRILECVHGLMRDVQVAAYTAARSLQVDVEGSGSETGMVVRAQAVSRA